MTTTTTNSESALPSPMPERRAKRVRIAGTIAVCFAIIQVLFQASIALGLPIGKAAYGGASSDVASGLRIVSAVAVVVYLFFASVLLQVADFYSFGYRPGLLKGVTWFLVIFMFFEAVLNWASRSPLERYLWGPFTLVFAISCLVLVKSAFQASSSDVATTTATAKEDDPLVT